VKTARNWSQPAVTGICCLLQWDHEADSCPSYTEVVDCCNSGPCPTSLAGLWLSDRLQETENLPLDDLTQWPNLPPLSTLSASRSAVTPVYHPHLTHPLAQFVMDWVGWDSQARSDEWPYAHYSGLAPCLHLSQAVRAIQYIPYLSGMFYFSVYVVGIILIEIFS